MSNPTIASVRSYLDTQLRTLIGTGSGKLMDVKAGHAVSFAGYPACRYFFGGTAPEVLKDQRSPYRTLQIMIEIVQKIANDDKTALEPILEDAAEAVMNLIDADYTLNNTVSNSVIQASHVREIEAPWGSSLMLPITLNAQILLFF